MNKNSLLKYLGTIIFVVLILFLLFFPFILNKLILSPQLFPYVGEGKDWLMFWATYISAIASFAMVFITWWTLRQNKNQLNEIKRQWEEENRPRLEIYFINDELKTKGLRIEVVNLGKSPAYDVKLFVDSVVISKAPNHATKDSLETIGLSCNILLSNESLIIGLCEENMNLRYALDYTIGKIYVEAEQYSQFYTAVTSMETINVTGNYNSKYTINSKISPKNKRNRYKDICTITAEVRDAIIWANYKNSETKSKHDMDKKTK